MKFTFFLFHEDGTELQYICKYVYYELICNNLVCKWKKINVTVIGITWITINDHNSYQKYMFYDPLNNI